MKKIIKLIGAFLCFVPFVVNAKYYYNYNDAVVKVNDYINTFANNDKYIYFPRNISRNDYYIGGVGSDNFTAGGLVNAEEFDITNVNGTSYLSSTSKYWTLSVPELQNNNRYVIDFEKDILSTSETSGIKVTQFIKDDAKVTGIGTRSNPFMFVNSSKVIIKTSDINKGGFSNNNTNCNNTVDTIIANVSIFREIHELCPAVGYTYDTDNCGDNVSIVNNSGKTKINIENKGYDAACNIEFAPITYYVKYNANDGSGSMPNSTHTYGTAKELTANTFTRSGYKFTGWNTKADGTGTSYAGGASVNNLTTTNGDTVNLYAKWTANTYTVVYNANGGSGSMSNSTHTYGTAKELTANAFTRTGYTFAGWNTKADGTGTSYAGGASVNNLISTNGGTVNLYAKWTVNTYTVVYNANGGSGSMSNSTHTYGTAKPLTSNTFTRTGYKFTGWNTKADGSGTSYANGASVNNLTSTNGGIFNLYAKWVKDVYTCNEIKNLITYSGNYSVECNGNNWKIKFLTSGQLRINANAENINVDIFLVGGGGGGGAPQDQRWFAYFNAAGGGGGYTLTSNTTLTKGSTYSITVGNGGKGGSHQSPQKDGEQSCFGGICVQGGKAGQGDDQTNWQKSSAARANAVSGGAGGSGGGGTNRNSTSMNDVGIGGTNGANGSVNGGQGQGRTTREFGESNGQLYSSGGYATMSGYNLGNYYTHNPNGIWSCSDPTHGGSSNCTNPGEANTGNGGNGAHSSSAGGSGIVIIRNKRD